MNQRIVFRLSNPDDYLALDLPQNLRSAYIPPGRAIGNDGREVQVATISADPDGVSQGHALDKLAGELVPRYPHGKPDEVRLLPAEVDPKVLKPPTDGRLRIPLGIDDQRLQPVHVDLDETPHFLVVGPDKSGRSTTLLRLASGIAMSSPRTELFLIMPRRSPLETSVKWTEVAKSTDQILALANKLAEAIKVSDGEDVRRLLVIDDGDELVDYELSNALETIVRKGKDRGVVVLGVLSQQHARRAHQGWGAALRFSRHGILLHADLAYDGDILSAPLPRRSGNFRPPGRGFLVNRGEARLIQVGLWA